MYFFFIELDFASKSVVFTLVIERSSSWQKMKLNVE